MRVSAVVLACTAVLAGCGGGGSSTSGTTAQSVDFPFPGSRYLASDPAPLNATASSGLAVTFSSNTPDICTVSDGKLVPVAVGECSITADQAGDSNFAPAAPAQQLFKVLKHPQTITFASPGFQDIAQGQITLTASSDSGLPVTFVSSTPDVCAASGTTLTLVSKGQCTVSATQPGDANYDLATPVSATFTVGDAPPPVLTLLSGYKSTSSTHEDGGISTFAGSNKDGWWCADANWCGSAISPDGSSFTYHYWIQPNDPNHPNTDNWIGAYYGFEIVAAGVGSISTTDNTTTGVKVDKQTTLKFTAGENTEWFSTITSTDPQQPGYHMADVRVTLTLGHLAQKNGSACNVAINTSFTPKTAAAQTYELQLSSFNAISESCGLSSLNAATELATYPIIKIKFEAASANTSAARTPDANPNPPTYPTELTLSGSVTVQ